MSAQQERLDRVYRQRWAGLVAALSNLPRARERSRAMSDRELMPIASARASCGSHVQNARGRIP